MTSLRLTTAERRRGRRVRFGCGPCRSIEQMVTLRSPVPGDAEGVQRAWDDARQFYSELDPQTFLSPDPTDTGLGRSLADRLIAAAERPDRLIRVATTRGETIGFITATLHEPADEPGRELMRDLTERQVTIDSLVVQRAHWRRGAGTALVEAVEAWARGAGAQIIKVTTYGRSGVSTAFYEAIGYGPRAVVFQKPLN